MSNEVTQYSDRQSLAARFENSRSKLAVGTGLALTGLLVAPTGALAQTSSGQIDVDYAPLTAGAKDQVEAVLPIALALIGLITAVFVGWKFASKMLGAKKPA